MKLTPQSALDLINNDIAKAFKNPKVTDGIELAIEKFVQTGLDAFIERQHLDVKVRFSVELDPKEGRYMAFLRGTF